MDAEELRQLKPQLTKYLKQFDHCFPRKDTRAHLPVYVTGQLSDLPRKSVEPIAVEADVAPRTLQEFLSQHRWDEDRARDRLQEIVGTEHAGPRAIGIIDETSFVKKGNKTPGVKRQWCGTVGKQDNCIVTVHLTYARDEFHCLVDGELYLPKDWADDPGRREQAGIPEGMTYRSKWQIGLELYDRAIGNGLRFHWITFDEWYGGKPGFLRGLSERGQQFVGEIPRNFVGWLKPPRVVTRPFHRGGRGRGRSRKVPRLASGSPPARRVDELLKRPELRDQPWQRWRIKDGEKGPMVWEIKHCRFTRKNLDGLPGEPMHLIVARDVLDPDQIKFFVCNAPPKMPIQTILLVGFSRWRVERCFEDHKGEVGLDHYEGRLYLGLKRHLILSAISYLFLARTRQRLGGEKPGANGVPSAHGHCGLDPFLVARAAGLDEVTPEDCGQDSENTVAQRLGTQISHKANEEAASQIRYQAHRPSSMPVGHELAL
jgi:SRSO17 transposase